MSRGTYIYIVMLAVFGTGLWAILSFGSILLSAPTDLAGKWELLPPVTEIERPAVQTPQHSLLVEQSGRYFKLSGNGSSASMKLASEQKKTIGPVEMVRVELRGVDGTATFDGTTDGDEFMLEMTDLNSGRWLARRVERHYPKPARPKRPTPPTPATQSAAILATAHASP